MSTLSQGAREALLHEYHAKPSGLTQAEASALLKQHGKNALPQGGMPSLPLIFFSQFLNPLIYILLAAAALSLWMGHITDAVFIFSVLLINGAIGTAQEYSAGRSAQALKNMEKVQAFVIRDGEEQQIDAEFLVIGDVVQLESGFLVPADIRLLEDYDLQIDESVLTGESLPVCKDAGAEEKQDAVVAERYNMAFAGTVVTRGRGLGLVVATGMQTEIGRIARDIGRKCEVLPPLMLRMERFTRNIATCVTVAALLMIVVGYARGMSLPELFMAAVGLAVSAIPEGLPIAISVALAISMQRMAKQGVIVRNMVAVESLGSCTMIATDKTGTLTLNELTVTDLLLPDGAAYICKIQVNSVAEGVLCSVVGGKSSEFGMRKLISAMVLPNEAMLVHSDKGWYGKGDPVDVALLATAHKAGISQSEMLMQHPPLAILPYEPDIGYAASFHQDDGGVMVCVKGAPEQILSMCSSMQIDTQARTLNAKEIHVQIDELASKGLRVLAFACGNIASVKNGIYEHHHLKNLVFLGLAGMTDPIRPEVPEAIRRCREAGVDVVMITGDAPKTAVVIARQAGIDVREEEVITGAAVKTAEAQGAEAVATLVCRAKVFARVEPTQKLAIVDALARHGHYVAVTGDGVNDAPALKHAHVGVAMGRKGTDTAKESADIILTDDNFASIVAGIQEGRVAYNNIRKVIFMLLSTGAAEVALFLLALLFGLPLPLLAVQLLWLNLVTNGIQDVALASEKAEGNELLQKPRKPSEPIINMLMLRRIGISVLVMGCGGFSVFYWLLANGYALEQARNILLLLFVLFENFQTFNSRSETTSVFRESIRANPFLVYSVITAQLLHIAAMHQPWLMTALHLEPISVVEWLVLLGIAGILLAAMEIDKLWLRNRKKI